LVTRDVSSASVVQYSPEVKWRKAMGAEIINGVWQTEPVRVKENNLPAPLTFDGLIAQLSSIIAAAPRLSHQDQKRLTDFVLAAGSMMLARTRLPPGDQKVFEAHLREAVSRQGGYG
jgi:hypothetical protein